MLSGKSIHYSIWSGLNELLVKEISETKDCCTTAEQSLEVLSAIEEKVCKVGCFATPTNVVVITDNGMDYDDMLALTTLASRQKMGHINLKAVICSTPDPHLGSSFIRGLLDCPNDGWKEVPIALGLSEVHKDFQRDKANPYLKECRLLAPGDAKFADPDQMLTAVLGEAKKSKTWLTILCLLGHKTLNKFLNCQDKCTSKTRKDLFGAVVVTDGVLGSWW